MGHSNVNAQLLTVPVYLFSAAVYIVLARLSEKYACRAPFLIFGYSIVLVGKSATLQYWAYPILILQAT